MAYVKILYQDSPSTATPLNAQNLNHMDDGIAENDRRLNELATAGVVNTFNSRTGNVTSEKGDYDINQIVASDGQEGYIPVWRNSGTEQEPDWGFEMESVSGGGGLATCNSVDISFAYVVTPSTDFSITEGLYLSVIFSSNFTYDGVHTLRLSIDGVGYDVKINGQNPTASVIYVKSGDAGIFVFDGTYFQLIGTSGGGHIIYTQEGSNMPQESGLQFADAFLTDDSINGKTIVENIKEVLPADYDSTTDEGIIVTDDGDDALIGPVSDEYVEVKADGTKTIATLLNELYTQIDADKINNNSCIKYLKYYYRLSREATNKYYFSCTLNNNPTDIITYSFEIAQSGSKWIFEDSNNNGNNVSDDSSEKPSNGTKLTLYYGNKKATVDLQTTANRCWYDVENEVTVKQKIDDLGKDGIGKQYLGNSGASNDFSFDISVYSDGMYVINAWNRAEYGFVSKRGSYVYSDSTSISISGTTVTFGAGSYYSDVYITRLV